MRTQRTILGLTAGVSDSLKPPGTQKAGNPQFWKGSVYEQNESSVLLGSNFPSSVVRIMVPGKTIRNIQS